MGEHATAKLREVRREVDGRGERDVSCSRKMAGMEANKAKEGVCKKNEFGKVSEQSREVKTA